MAYKIEVTRQYLKDLKLARRRNLDERKLNTIIQALVEGRQLPENNKDHVLKGNYVGYRECHISPDWLLIYSKHDSIKVVRLIRTGTHSDLF